MGWIIKYEGSLCCDSFSVTRSSSYVGVTWPSLHLPVRNGTQEPDRNAGALANTIAPSNKASWVSDPGIPPLLLASMKLRQADGLAGTGREILDPRSSRQC